MNRALLTGVAVFATGTLVLGAGYVLPPAGDAREPAGVSVPAADTRLACPGPMRAQDVAEGTDSEFVTPSGAEQALGVVGVPAEGASEVAQTTVTAMAERGPGEELFSSGDGAAFADTALPLESAAEIRGVVAGSTPAMVAGTQYTAAGDGDLRGLAAGACTAPSADQWLLAGGGTVGESTRLALSNPGSTAAEITVEVIGEGGEVPLEGQNTLTVAPGGSQELSLEALAPDVESPAVRVTSTGGLVSAALLSSVLDGLDPAGVEVTGASAAPATDVVVPGVAVAEEPDEARLPQVLRIANPSDSVAEVGVRATSVDGDAEWPRRTTSVPARGVRDVAIGDLDPRTYAFSLDSSVPVTASARAGNGDGTDFAWTSAAPELSGVQALALPAGSEPTLVSRSASGATPLLVTPVGEDGSLGEPVQLDAGETLTETPLADAFGGTVPAAILVRRSDEAARVHAGVVLRRDDGLASLPLPQAPTGAGTAAVRIDG